MLPTEVASPRVKQSKKGKVMSATLKRHDYKGYTIEEHDWEISFNGECVGHAKRFFITKGKDRFGMPILVRFLRLNGQQVKINSITTAKRFITLYENKRKEN